MIDDRKITLYELIKFIAEAVDKSFFIVEPCESKLNSDTFTIKKQNTKVQIYNRFRILEAKFDLLIQAQHQKTQVMYEVALCAFLEKYKANSYVVVSIWDPDRKLVEFHSIITSGLNRNLSHLYNDIDKTKHKGVLLDLENKIEECKKNLPLAKNSWDVAETNFLCAMLCKEIHHSIFAVEVLHGICSFLRPITIYEDPEINQGRLNIAVERYIKYQCQLPLNIVLKCNRALLFNELTKALAYHLLEELKASFFEVPYVCKRFWQFFSERTYKSTFEQDQAPILQLPDEILELIIRQTRSPVIYIYKHYTKGSRTSSYDDAFCNLI